MKKRTKILAVIGVISLVLLYVSTLFFAFFDKSTSQWLLKTSIMCTIIIPILLYVYTMVYKSSKKDQTEDEQHENTDG